MFNHYKLIISCIVIIILSLTTFVSIIKITFQQDEWLGLGGAMYRQQTYGTVGSVAQVFNFENKKETTRFLPVASILNHFIYNAFKFNFAAYGILALTIMVICGILLNLSVYKITNSYLLSTLTSIMWLTNNLAYQAFTWIAAMVPSLFSVLFFLLGLYCLLLFREKMKTYFFIASIFLMILSILSKESSIFYFVVYLGLIWFFFKEKVRFIDKIKLTFLSFIPIFISAVIPRVIYLFYHQNNFASPLDGASKTDLIYNFFQIPAKSLFHIFLSNEQIYQLVYSSNRIFFANQIDGYVVGRIVGDAFSLLAAFYILMVICLITIIAIKANKKIIIFSLLSFFASTLPFIVFKSESTSLEQRYYVFPAIFSSLLTVTVINSLTSRLRNVGKILTVLIFIPILLFYIGGVRKMLDGDIKTGNYRKEILETVSTIKPTLGKDNIFYFFTEHNGFYEFQSGFGQTLAVYFYDTGKIPKEALIDKDFWDLSYEGLKTFDKGKFGYYMTYSKLLNGLRENKDISLDIVHSFYWEYQDHKVKDVSTEIREKLATDLK